ncbi:hypothetical protein C8Q76DRAFT_206040 [Earliella scabrosa]|nr:hypothetical protein C8Q76DRAFT_206040 [Earliella scabrosa]
MNSPLYAPFPGIYAVIRVDPVAMVQHLDRDAILAAESLNPKSYLVYINTILALPFPNKPWYLFSLMPVAPSSPQRDDEQRITPEMCTPIFPNAARPAGREPLRTTPIFPYTNCYHCTDACIDVRVLARPEGFIEEEATKLPADQRAILGRNFAQDRADTYTNWCSGGLDVRGGFGDATPSDVHVGRTGEDMDVGRLVDADVIEDGDGTASLYSHLTLSSTAPSDDPVDTMINMGMFGDPTANVEVLPLVHLWMNLGENLKQEEITDPIHLYEERDAIVR